MVAGGSRQRARAVDFAARVEDGAFQSGRSREGSNVAAPRGKRCASVCSVLLGTLGVVAVAPAEGAYPRRQGQEHFGGECTPYDTMIAGGTIVGIGGQVVAGGGGTGVGCDTFYAYEVRVGQPAVARPWTEPGVYLNPGRTVPRLGK